VLKNEKKCNSIETATHSHTLSQALAHDKQSSVNNDDSKKNNSNNNSNNKNNYYYYE